MPTLLNKPVLTKLHSGWDSFLPDTGSTFIYGHSVEERSIHPEEWENSICDVNFVRIWSYENSEQKDFSRCMARLNGSEVTLHLRNHDQLQGFITNISSDIIFIDITGLAHHVWAPLLRAAVETDKTISVVYVEPQTYTFSSSPTEAQIFDLSEEIHDISPLPGFGVLGELENEASVIFIPLLGFEGHRLANVIEQVQPPAQNIIPVIGVPGFKPVFPFYAYQGNRNKLRSDDMFTRVRYAHANSPFSVLYVLEKIAEEYPDHFLKIAPIGTKPHGLGAILFTLSIERSVEIVYDHPIRKQNRTVGSANILVYAVSSFFALRSV